MYRLPRLNVDEWSTNEDLTKAWALATQLLKDKNGVEGTSRNKESDCLDIEFGGKVDETLCGHASFTLSLLERLCFVLSDSGLLDHLPESLGAIADAKALHAETFALKDRVTKLTAEIIDMRVRLHESEQQKNSAEKALDRSTIEHSRKTTNGASSDIAANSSSSADGGLGPPEDTRISPSGSSSDSKEVLFKIATLEKQLAESEGAKARAEMTLTERLARPLSQTEAQVTDMRRAMEDLRQQGRQRVSSLISEGKGISYIPTLFPMMLYLMAI
jgi:hypothetical protein